MKKTENTKPDRFQLLDEFIRNSISGKELANFLTLLGVKLNSFVKKHKELSNGTQAEGRGSTQFWYSTTAKKEVPSAFKYMFYEVIRSMFEEEVFCTLWSANYDILKQNKPKK